MKLMAAAVAGPRRFGEPESADGGSDAAHEPDGVVAEAEAYTSERKSHHSLNCP